MKSKTKEGIILLLGLWMLIPPMILIFEPSVDTDPHVKWWLAIDIIISAWFINHAIVNDKEVNNSKEE